MSAASADTTPAQSSLAASPASAAGTPAPPKVLFHENFENGVGSDPVLLSDYIGESGTTYSADQAWLTNCNGAVLELNSPDAALDGPAINGCKPDGNPLTSHTWYDDLRRLAYALGVNNGSADANTNHAVAAFTAGKDGDLGADKIEFQTSQISLPSANGRFLTFGLSAVAQNCNVSGPEYNFSLVSTSGAHTQVGSTVNVCDSTRTIQVPALGAAPAGEVAVGDYSSNGSILFDSSSVGFAIRNANESSNGNDAAFDDLTISDATPQLRLAFAQPTVETGATTTLTFTVTNTSELAAKNGWSFQDRLPAGLRVVDSATPGGTCTAQATVAADRQSIIVANGALAQGQSSCTVTLPVSAAATGTYTNEASAVTVTGLDAPASADVTFVDPPSISTAATDKADGDKMLSFRGGVVKDVVSYQNLTPGTEYTMSGELMDKATSQSTGIKGSKTFTPTTANGSVEIDFTVSAADAGKSLVAFEDLSDASGAVAKHEDINSAAQTVSVGNTPAVTTTATDKADGDKMLSFRGGVVKDMVSYQNLTPGTEYTMSGELMDKATGQSTGIKGSKTFTPTTANGSVEIDFTVPAGDAGKTLVAYEIATKAGLVVATHKDINSAAQTVTVDQKPAVTTTATDKADGDQELAANGGVVADMVKYTGLTPGVEYTVKGELMNKATGKSTGIKATKKFTPTTADGSVEIDFNLPNGFAGDDLVAFEVALDAQGVVATHEDINAKSQTVHVDTPNTPNIPMSGDAPGASVNTGGTVDNTNTAGEGWLFGSMAAGLLAAIGAAGIWSRRKTSA